LGWNTMVGRKPRGRGDQNVAANSLAFLGAFNDMADVRGRQKQK